MNAPTPIGALRQSSICSQIMADLADAGPMQMPMTADQFNSDDLYVYDSKTKRLIYSLPSSSHEVQDARHIGFRVAAGQTWAKGMTAKYLGLWRAL